jgi:hypothetical protein
MTYLEALDLLNVPDIARLRELCAEDHPNRRQRDAFRRRVIEQAGGRPSGKVGAYPRLANQIGSALSAAVDFASSGGKTVDSDERARRLAICQLCDHYDSGRCRKCGCFMNLKARIATAKCPVDKW